MSNHSQSIFMPRMVVHIHIIINLNISDILKYKKPKQFKSTPVGEIIRYQLLIHDIMTGEMAEYLKIEESVLLNIINGKKTLPQEMTSSLEDVLGLPSGFLMNVQRQYENDCQIRRKRKLMRSKVLYWWCILMRKIKKC